jgi:ATP-dependent Clp protease ATP-binding subunit ClpA
MLLRAYRPSRTSGTVAGAAVGYASSRHAGMGPFDRFDDRAKRVLALAQDEAIRFNHNYIGTEHLLLGLVREGESVAARVLDSLGVELSKVRTAVEFSVGRGDSTTSPSEIMLTPRTKKVIELAIDEARNLGHRHVRTEHLLLGLVREGEGIASGMLESLGVSYQNVRRELMRMLSQPYAESAEPRRGPFDRFNAGAKRVLALAQDEALRFNHNYIGAEHLLLGLIRQQESIAGAVLRRLGVELERARTALKFIVGAGESTTSGELIVSPRAKKIMELAVAEADRLGHTAVGPEHLLLGLVVEGGSIGVGILEYLHVSPEAVRREVVETLGRRPGGEPPAAER